MTSTGPCHRRYDPVFYESVGDSDGEFIERLWNVLNFVAIITKSMKKETRLELLELAIQTANKNMSYNLFKALLKRKEDRLLILGSIKNKLRNNNINPDDARRR